MEAEFVRNNIRYRSASSKALEGYFNSKAFILNELETPSYKFSETAKEIVSLLFNRHSELLIQVETFLLDKDSLKECDILRIKRMIRLESLQVKRIVHHYSSVFDKDIVRHWIEVHKQCEDVLLDQIDDLQGISQILAFPLFTEQIIEYLTSSLFEMYELDTFFGSDIVDHRVSDNNTQPVAINLYVSNMMVRHSQDSKCFPEVKRFRYYREHCTVEPSVVIRDYSTGQDENSQIDYCKSLSSLLCAENAVSVQRIVP